MKFAINVLKAEIESLRGDIAFYKNKRLPDVSLSDAYRHKRIEDITRQIVKLESAIRILQAYKERE